MSTSTALPSAPSTSDTPSASATKAQSTAFLRSLLNKNLRVTTTDSRMFWGTFKCTDSESNLILQHTYEYRPPTAQQVSEAAAASDTGAKAGKVKVDMTSRYMGLVVVPGKHIVRIEVEEFVSQMRGRERLGLRKGEGES
ncbi:hypothetical protein VTK26DRAFT_7272 [Humicola hyalothermophila]